ncbi:MAG: heavy-metal-associated domain-containing protein [Bacillota bacterium]|nr:heavy-metal-associated domain-containing protein [Bacillota bacterium]
MKSVLRVFNMNSINDVTNIRNAVANNEGVIACQINRDKGEVELVYDTSLVELDRIIESLEDLGYTVL